MATKIQHRRDTTTNWVSTNPVLAAGEFGVDTDLGKTKLGDGTTPWNDLSFDAATAETPPGFLGEYATAIHGPSLNDFGGVWDSGAQTWTVAGLVGDESFVNGARFLIHAGSDWSMSGVNSNGEFKVTDQTLGVLTKIPVTDPDSWYSNDNDKKGVFYVRMYMGAGGSPESRVGYTYGSNFGICASLQDLEAYTPTP